MDNFHIDITSEGDLGKAMEVAFSASKSAVAYVEEGAPDAKDAGAAWGSGTAKRRLIFLWYADNGAVNLPVKLDAKAAADIAERWLAEQDYGREPDHDGDNGRGWRLYNESWGHVGNYHGAIVAVEPRWALYGK